MYGVLAQWLERCADNTEDAGSNPVDTTNNMHVYSLSSFRTAVGYPTSWLVNACIISLLFFSISAMHFTIPQHVW